MSFRCILSRVQTISFCMRGMFIRRIAVCFAVAGLTLAMPLGVAGRSTVVEIEIERDITVNGIDPDDRAGFSVAVGDINNDGADDLIIGAPERDPGGRTGAGWPRRACRPAAATTARALPNRWRVHECA